MVFPTLLPARDPPRGVFHFVFLQGDDVKFGELLVPVRAPIPPTSAMPEYGGPRAGASPAPAAANADPAAAALGTAADDGSSGLSPAELDEAAKKAQVVAGGAIALPGKDGGSSLPPVGGGGGGGGRKNKKSGKASPSPPPHGRGDGQGTKGGSRR